ncbi:uncharacterized protein LOC136078276 [Hydra vulgaris]|uniref:Uncharacterized protein LOC136078276 n=1 Tax=Hydra vulgaris TaxID=6087 RepID=A0ABM4BL59_HYDVU
MIKAVLVKYLGERKIVIANNSSIIDFLNNVSKKFASTSGNICGITWNRCNVDEDTFVAILNEQNLEVEAMSLPVSKLYSSSFCQMSSCLPAEYCSKHSSNPPLLTYDETPTSHQQSSDQSNLESAADVSEPVFIQEALAQKRGFSQSSLTGISSQLSYTAQVAFASNPLTNAIQKVRLNCCICDFKTYRPYIMISHLKLHGQAGSVVCDNCFTKFKSVRGFQLHYKNCLIPITMIEDVEEIDDTVEEIDIEIPTENRKLGALALHLRGKYRCSENVVNIIFSNVKDILTDNTPKEELSTIFQQLSAEYLRKQYFKNAFNVPKVESISENGLQGSYISFKEILKFYFDIP